MGAGATLARVQGSHSRDVPLSAAAAWRLTWGREGWRVIRAEPTLSRGHHPAFDVVIRYALQRTPDARYPPSTPAN